MLSYIEHCLEWGGTKKDIIVLTVSALALIAVLFFPQAAGAVWIPIVLCGIPIFLEAALGLASRFDIKADVLVAMALIASLYIGEYFAAGEVAFIMELGALLEELTVQRARAGIEKLARLSPQSARILLPDGAEKIVPVEQVQVGDRLRALPGEAVPVDGIILAGHSSINQAILTGESMPMDKSPGDEVFSGTINQFGIFEMEAVRVGKDSSIQRMIRLVESADSGSAKIVKLADRWATWIVLAALVSAFFAWLGTGDLVRGVTVLVVFCPCALVLATPTAIMAALGAAAKRGFLIRRGDALERLAATTRAVFDKTGTITLGCPRVAAIESCSDEYSSDELYALTAAAEQYSEHPLGKAIVLSFTEKYSAAVKPVQNFRLIPGRGVQGCVENKEITVGNDKLFSECGIEIHKSAREQIAPYLTNGATVMNIAVNNQYCGFLALSDTIRPGAAEVIGELISRKIQPILLTGDNSQSANAIAQKLRIETVRANCLPEDKLNIITQYQNSGQPVCMTGDGINDAPALKKAHVGIAMGGIGSDIAADAADIVLVNDSLSNLPYLFSLSKRMMAVIKWNIVFSMGLNFLAIFLAIGGFLNPVSGALVHNAGSIVVIINSALLLKWNGKSFYTT